jgi:outer membrane protein
MGIGRRRGWRGWVLVLGIIVGLSLVDQAYAQKSLKVGVVDLQAVLDGSVRGKAAKDRLKELGVQLQEDIKTKREFKEEREKELQKLRSEIQSQGLVLSEQARVDKEENFRKQVRELKRFIDDTNRFIEDATQEFREREARETRLLLLEVRKVVQEMGKQDGYSLILEGNESAAVVLYFHNTIDLTPKVIQRYDQSSAAKQ